MANEAQVKQLLELVGECTKTAVDSLIAQADWGEINFEPGRPVLERTFKVLNQFRRLPIGLLPDGIIEQIIATLRPLSGLLEKIRRFSVDQEDPRAARDQLLAQYGQQADRFLCAALLYNCLSCVLEGRRSPKYNCLVCILKE